jgi:SAM-dependent methyltransferase
VSGYGEDLAHIHDVGFGHYALNAAPGLLETLRRGGVTRGLVIDLGCGSGLWAEKLIGAGYDVLGIDQSAAMVALARRRVPAGKFQVASFLDARLPPCDAVTSMGECLCYLFDPKNGKDELQRLFARVHEVLRPGGLFVFDVAQPGQIPGGLRVAWWEGDDWAVLLRAEEDRKARLLTRRMTTFRRVGKLYRRGEETHQLRLYRGAELAAELRKTGFRARVLGGYGAFRLPGKRVVLLARKR